MKLARRLTARKARGAAPEPRWGQGRQTSMRCTRHRWGAGASGPSGVQGQRPWPVVPVLTCLAILIACAPLLCARLPPLYDYPAHLARMHITADLLSQRRFAAMYALHPAIVPNLATDLFVVPLALAGMDIEIAGRLCLAAIILGIGIGAIRLNRALTGGRSALPILAFGLVYAEPFRFGFLNYVAGIAMLLNALAFWIGARHRGPRRLALIGLLACGILFFCHLIACVLFIGAVLTLEAFAAVRAGRAASSWRPALRRAAALLPGMALAALLYVLAPLAGKGAHDSFVRQFLKHLPSKRERLGMLIQAVDGYRPWLDRAGIAVLLAVLAGLLWRGRLRCNAAMLCVIAGITAVFAIFPDHWAGTSYIADRIPFLIALLALCALDPAPRTARGRAAFTALILALVLIRGISAAASWRAADIAYAPLLDALSKLPAGARIYTATMYEDSAKSELSQPYSHIAAFAALRNPVFDGGVFADPAQNIVIRRPAFAALGKLVPKPFRTGPGKLPAGDQVIFAPALLAAYDDVLVVHPEEYPMRLPAVLAPLQAAGPAVLYGIRHEAQAGGDVPSLPDPPPGIGGRGK